MKLLCTEPPPRLKEQGKWSETFHSFIASCLRPEPSERPTAVELLSHPFILQAISSGGIHTVPVRLATEFGLGTQLLQCVCVCVCVCVAFAYASHSPYTRLQ